MAPTTAHHKSPISVAHGCTTGAQARKFRFTTSKLDSLSVDAGETQRQYFYDEKQTGLAFAIAPGGKRSLIFSAKIRKPVNKAVRYLILPWPDYEAQKPKALDDARSQASAWYALASRGIDPDPDKVKREKQAATDRAAITLRKLFDLYIADRLSQPKPMRTENNFRSIFDCHLAEWENRRLSDISEDDVTELHEAIGAKHRHTANRTLELLRALLNFGMKKKFITENPAANFTKFEELPRQRAMGLQELAVFRTALAAEPDELWKDFFGVALFSAARKANIQSMRFDELDLDNKLWVIPASKSKSGKELRLNLSSPVYEILKRRLANSDSEWVFKSPRRSSHVVESKAAWGRLLDRAAEIEIHEWLKQHPGKNKGHFSKQKRGTIRDIHLHDCRRTLAEQAAKAGASLLEIGLLLGHEAGSKVTAKSYLHLVGSFAAQAAENAAARIEQLAAPLMLESENAS
jgi:integrase